MFLPTCLDILYSEKYTHFGLKSETLISSCVFQAFYLYNLTKSFKKPKLINCQL